MATLASGGRITEEGVTKEIRCLRYDWGSFQEAAASNHTDSILREFVTAEALETIDHFDRVQLAEVIRVYRTAKSLADAGRSLFNVSRTQRTSANDSHRLRIYLQKYELTFQQLT